MKPKDILTKDILLQETQNGLTTYEIAKKYHITDYKSVIHHSQKFNIPQNLSRLKRKIFPTKAEIFISLKILTKKQVSKKYNISYSTLNKIINFIKIPTHQTYCALCNKQNLRKDYKYCSVECRNISTKRLMHNDFSIITPEAAYYGGFIFGDGSVNSTALQVCLSNNKYNTVLLQGLSNFIFKKDYICYYTTKLHLRATNQNLIDNLTRHYNILPNKTYKHILNIPNGFEADFIRGYFDADGWICIGKSYNEKYNKFYNRYCFGICSYLEDNLLKIQNLLPVKSSINKKKTQHLYELRVNSKNDIITLRDYLYYDNCISLENKKCKMFSIN